jgi:uncharacterized membrane protein YqgA involved in biofilm formation
VFIGLGTVINISTIIIGSTLGIFLGSKFTVKTRETITTALAFITLLAAADAIKSLWDPTYISQLPKGWTILVVLLAMLIGTLIGVKLRIEDRLEVLGAKLKEKFDKEGKSPFIEGFVSSSLLFVIGPMAILGSISDGMQTGISQLTLKSILDGITSIAFAASLGWGVALSALPVGIYQFVWTGIGFGLGAVLPHYQVLAMTVTGGLLLLGIAFRLMKIRNVPVADFLPAIFLAPIIAGLVHFLAK